MKLSLATPTALLCAAAVQAFPQVSTDTTAARWWSPTPTQTTEPLAARTEDSVPVASPTIQDDIVAQASVLVQAAKSPDDPWDDQEKILRDLEKSRKAVIERLLEAQEKQRSVEVQLNTQNHKLNSANQETDRVEQDLDGLKDEEVALAKRIQATKVQLKEARKFQSFVKLQHSAAVNASTEATAEIKKLRETIQNIDESIKNIGVPED